MRATQQTDVWVEKCDRKETDNLQGLLMKIAYIDCFSGISGDMFLGALLDLGLPRTVLKQGLAALPLAPYKMVITSQQRMNITGRQVKVTVPTQKHHHRNSAEITRIITKSTLSKEVKDLSINVFQRLAAAEAKIHHKKISEVHFHEVGAIDSIIDIVGTAIGMAYLKFDEVYASPVPLSSGFTTCQHGVLPLPAPATVELLKGVPVCGTSLKTELVTPTGAALLTTIATHYQSIPPMKITKTGYGVGSTQLKDRPNLLRIIVGEQSDLDVDQVLVLEANIDDMVPELYEYLMEQLLKKGALDVSFSPIQMKKNRPGTLLRVICPPEKKGELINIIFQESTSAGIRYYHAHRMTLPRETRKISTPFGTLSVKVFKDAQGEYYALPEYEQCKRIAKKNALPLKKVYQEVAKLLPPLK